MQFPMAKGVRELFVEALVEASFTRVEANSLVSTWSASIRPQHLGVLGDIARAIHEEVSKGAPLTTETTRRAFHMVQDSYQENQFVYFMKIVPCEIAKVM